jgi:hypothetical protein
MICDASGKAVEGLCDYFPAGVDSHWEPIDNAVIRAKANE